MLTSTTTSAVNIQRVKTNKDDKTKSSSEDQNIDTLCARLEILKKKELDYELHLLRRNMELIRAII